MNFTPILRKQLNRELSWDELDSNFEMTRAKFIQIDSDINTLVGTLDQRFILIDGKFTDVNSDLQDALAIIDEEFRDTLDIIDRTTRDAEERLNIAIDNLENTTQQSITETINSIAQLQDTVDSAIADFDQEVLVIKNDIDERIQESRNELTQVRDDLTLSINTETLAREQSDLILQDTVSIVAQLQNVTDDITGAFFDVDPITGTVTNLAFSYADNKFSEAGILIDGVNARIDLEAQRVTVAENRITNAESAIELQAGQINLRATYAEVTEAIAGAVDAVLPAYSFGFFNSTEGWVAVNGTITSGISKVFLTHGDIQNNSLSYIADENPLISLSIERTGGTGWVGDLVITFDDNSTKTFSGVIGDVVEGNTFLRNLNLGGNADYTGTVTGVRFILGESVSDTFTINAITIGKPSAALTELESITAQINQVGIDLNALEASLTSYVTVDRYDAEGVTRSNVESVLNGVESYAAITATLQEFDTNDTLTKANYAAQWVDAANANIRSEVQAYKTDEIDPELNAIRGDLTTASSLIDAANGKISDQLVSISGIKTDSKELAKIALQAEYQLYLSKKNQLEQGVAIALAKNELNTISNEQLALAEEILLLESKFGTDVGQINATVFQLNQALSNETEARTQALTILEADFNQTVNATVDVIFEAIADSEQALTQQITSLQAQFNSSIAASAQDLITLIANEEEARITQFNNLSSQFTNDINATKTELTTIITSADQAIVESINQLESNIGTTYATKTELSSAIATETQARVTQLSQVEANFNQEISTNRSQLIELIANEESARISSIDNLNANIANTFASKTEVNNIVANEAQARITSINNLYSDVEDNFATINQVNEIENDLESSKAIAQTSLISISGAQKKADSLGLQQLLDNYQLYIAKKNQMEAVSSIARAENNLSTLSTETLAQAQELLVLESKINTTNIQLTSNFNQLNQTITNETQARVTAISNLSTTFNNQLIAQNDLIRSVQIDVAGNAESITLISNRTGTLDNFAQAQILLNSSFNQELNLLDARAFIGVSSFENGVAKVNGLLIGGINNALEFTGNTFMLTDLAGVRRLYWDIVENTWVFNGRLLINGQFITDIEQLKGNDGSGFYSVRVQGNRPTLSDVYISDLFFNVAGRVNQSSDVIFITWDNNSDAFEFNGTSWISPSLLINGSIIASGTIAGDKITANAEINSPILKGGTFIVADNTVEFMSVIRAIPFGSANDLVEWFGPRINGTTWNTETQLPIYNNLTKANAKTYKTRFGDVYFGGTFRAGVLSNSLSNTILTATPVREMTFGSNGGLIELAVSFSYSDTESNFSGTLTCPTPQPATPSVTLWLEELVGGTWVIRGQQTFNGTYNCIAGGGGDPRVQQRGVGGSITFTDSARTAANRNYRARASVANYFSSVNTFQTLSITSSEA